jgi:hypothetical protein
LRRYTTAHTVEALLLRLSLDAVDEVSELTVTRVLPAVTAWLVRCGGADRVAASLLPAVVSRLLAVLARGALGGGQFVPLREDDRWRAAVLLRLLTGLIPSVRQAAARTVPPSLRDRGAVEDTSADADADADAEGDEAGESKPKAEGEAEAQAEAGVKGAGAPRVSAAGDEEVDAALARFAAAPRGSFAAAAVSWPAAEWLVGDGLALIAALARAAPPLEESTRRAMMTALRSYCLVVGARVTATCVAPVMAAASGGVACIQGDDEAANAAAAAAAAALPPAAGLDPALLAPPTAPAFAAAAAVARATALPLFLVAVLPHAGDGALATYLRGLITAHAAAAAAANRGALGLGLPDDILGAIHFAASFEFLTGPLLGLLGELSGASSAAVRSAAASLLGAAAAAMGEAAVTRQALPVLASLRGDRDEECQRHAAEAFATIAEAHPTTTMTAQVAAQLDVLLEQRKPGLTLAVVHALEGAGRCPGTPYCAHAARCLVAVARREVPALVGAPAGGGELAPCRALGEALFTSIQSVLGSDDGSQGLHAVLAPALQALLAGDAALDASERSLAEAMLRDEDWQGKAAEAAAARAGKGQPTKKKTYYGRMKGAVRKAAGYSSSSLSFPANSPAAFSSADAMADWMLTGAGGASISSPDSPTAGGCGEGGPPGVVPPEQHGALSPGVAISTLSLADVLGEGGDGDGGTPAAGGGTGEAARGDEVEGATAEADDRAGSVPSTPPRPPAPVPGVDEDDEEVAAAAAAAAAVVASGGAAPAKKKSSMFASVSAPKFPSTSFFSSKK